MSDETIDRRTKGPGARRVWRLPFMRGAASIPATRDDSDRRDVARPGKRLTGPAGAKRWRGPPSFALTSYLLTVAMPAAGIALYYAAFAADQYIATARFTVREVVVSPMFEGRDAVEDAADGVKMGPDDAASHLTYVVASYLRSRAVIEALQRDAGLSVAFQRPEADAWARLPDTASIEDLTAYWEDQVSVAVDGRSKIVTFRVRAFAPEDARRLNAAALKNAETLVNAMTQRRKRDALERARQGAAVAERRLRDAIAALSALRDAEGLIDPDRAAGETLRLLGDLMAERIRVASRIDALGALIDGDSPQVSMLRARRDRLDADIAAQRDLLAGARDASIAAAVARFEELEVRRRFAETLYEIAEAAALDAEIEMARQSVYVEVFDPPATPQDSRYPERAAFSILAFVGLSALWAIVAMVVASVRDHRIAP